MCSLLKRSEYKAACCSCVYLFIKKGTIKWRRKEKNEEKQKSLIKVWPQASFTYKGISLFVHKKVFNEYKSRIIN